LHLSNVHDQKIKKQKNINKKLKYVAFTHYYQWTFVVYRTSSMSAKHFASKSAGNSRLLARHIFFSRRVTSSYLAWTANHRGDSGITNLI